MSEAPSQVEHVEVDGGRIAYDVAGEGPLVILSPGMGDTRRTYRFLAPLLVAAGYRVAAVDLRGHGDSSTGWSSYTRTDTASDLLAVVRALGGPAVIVGQSFSGGSATIAAATAPDLVSAIVEIGTFTRPPSFSLGAFVRNAPYRRGVLLLARLAVTGSLKAWAQYLDVAYPGRKPADWTPWLADLLAGLGEPGRAQALRKMALAMPTDAAAHLAGVRCPALIVMGRADSDFADPEAEAHAIVDLMPDGVGEVAMIDDAGHYPHAEYPAEVAAAVVDFLGRRRG